LSTEVRHPIFDQRHVEHMLRVKAVAPPDPGWRYRLYVARRLDALRVALSARAIRNEV
jgi:hypothetical protein